ncbi:biosynthetic-type acetolactate synthase large subunit [Desulfoluna butyratoxydans]|uniref:Acetolactate synthase n=1 Tax=Desulfoluna butyratoxydans TaxID=231438 RepID=A0A4U8YMP1_9BACT|nr:biosynthetic-type acetolactate synthase large subunit [Desulfoluna butyratoxydans]VFQ45325.1 acetolactate synthase large subunit biosynthetic [Desulfoluna butyratoxydans]
MEYSGAEIVIKLLERQGVECLAGIPGGTNLPLYDALRESPIRHILARHEQGAGFIAQGMARSTGVPAVCFATSGPGVTNLITAIADAHLDSVPVVAISGQTPMSLMGTDAFQEVDTFGMSLPVTKHNFLVRSAAELLEVIPEAFRIAMSGRPGPVWVDIPKDVQTELIDIDTLPEKGTRLCPASPEEAALARAAEIINASERPVFYAGGGIINSGAGAKVRELCEKAGIPVVTTLMGLGIMPSDSPLSLGMLGMHGSRATNLILDQSDLLIAAGVRFDDRATGRIAAFCPHARIIHMDIDGAEIDKLRPSDCSITGDAGEILSSLLPKVADRARRTWESSVAAMKEAHPTPAGELDDAKPPALIRRIGMLAEAGTFVSTDVGQHQMWVAQHYPHHEASRLLTSGGLGTMGFGLPAAIGAALANPEAPVICFSGDGSIMMNIQELATLAEQDLNVKVIVLNNGALGLVRQQQELFYGARYMASQYNRNPDLTTIARGFGIPGRRLPLAACTDGALTEFLHARGPALLDIAIPQEANVFPMVPPGAANTRMIEEGATHD